MRLHEYEAKRIFARHGIPVPRGQVTGQPEEAARIALSLGGPAVVKAQVLAGGRGRAGGIRQAASPEEAQEHTRQLLGSCVRGLPVEAVLVEERLDIVSELYLGIAVDGAVGRPAVMLSADGGVGIEELATNRPEALASIHADPLSGLSAAQARQLAEAAGLGGETAADAARLAELLYGAFASCDAQLAEINPLALQLDGRLVAADAVLELDDAALFRHPEWHERAGDRQVGGMTFVELDGQIGLVCSGAGLGMATMDLIAEQARPANFLETGGAITEELMETAMRRVLARPGLQGVLINIYGGINPIHEGARGIARVMAEGVSVPVVAKAFGNFQDETWAILEEAGVQVVRSLATEDAVAELLRRIDSRPGPGAWPSW